MSIRYSVNELLKQFEQDFITHNLIKVSQKAILHNFDTYAKETGKIIIPVLKSNAYGHGLELVATALQQRSMPYIAVDSYYEALRIRNVSKQPVLIMGAIDNQNFSRLKYDNFAFVVQDFETIHALDRVGKHIKVHLECNTGMNRYGAQPNDTLRLARLIKNSKNLELEGLMTHLAMGAETDQSEINKPSDLFEELMRSLQSEDINPPLRHIAQSSGSLRLTTQKANVIRLGIALYGLNPFDPSHKLYDHSASTLTPALSVQSTITHINSLNPGDKVSYGYTYTAQKSEKIGVIPYGYYDGLDREALSNRGLVKIGNAYAPIVGRICMNHTMINLGGINAKIGDKVVIISNQQSDRNTIDRIARDYGLFNYSMATSLIADTRRILVD